MSGSPPAGTASPRLSDPWLLGLVWIGLVLRVVVSLRLDPGMVLVNDERVYAGGAAFLLAHGTLETGEFVRPPLYFLFLAGCQWLAPDVWRGVAKLVQCVLGAATALPIYTLAGRAGGRTVARLAAGFWIFDPTAIAYTHLLWPEVLFTALAAWVFAQVHRLETRSPAHCLGVGIAIGLAMLLKPVFGLFAAILALWWWKRLEARAALRLTALVGIAAILSVAPWVVRNQLRYGPSIILENQGPYNLWVGNDPRPSPWILTEWSALPDPVTRSRVGLERGLASIREDPARFVGQVAVRAVKTWGLEFFTLRNAILGSYGQISRERLLLAFWALQAAWATTLLCAAAGAGVAWRTPELRPVLVYAAALTLLVSLMVATTRFRVPLLVPVFVTAGLGVQRIASRRLGWSGWLAVALACCLLGLSASRPVFRKLASGDFQDVSELRRSDWMLHRY